MHVDLSFLQHFGVEAAVLSLMSIFIDFSQSHLVIVLLCFPLL